MKEFNITREYECEISGTLSPAEKGSPRTMDGPGTPYYAATVEDLYIGVIIKGSSINITHLLSERQREHLEAVLLEEAQEKEEADRDAADDRKYQDAKDSRLLSELANGRNRF